MMASILPILTIGYTGSSGGAGRATRDFANSAASCIPGSYSVFATDIPMTSRYRIAWAFWWLFRVFEHGFTRLLFRHRQVKQSLNGFTEPKIKRLLRTCRDDVRLHIHWIANSTIAIRDLSSLPSGTIITLHDEWLIAGTSHYASAPGFELDRQGRGPFVRIGNCLDRWAFTRKKRLLSDRKDLLVTVPSNWMKSRVLESGVFSRSTVVVIPNAVDTVEFSPDLDRRALTRRELGLGDQDFLICFGADRVGRNPIKGTDLFVELLEFMSRQPQTFFSVTVVVFGGLKIQLPENFPIRIIEVGQIASRKKMADLFRASDVVLHLARLEAFGLVPCEAMSCGTPVICFSNSGAGELVLDGETGHTCTPFDIESVAAAITKMVSACPATKMGMRVKSRNHMKAEYSLAKLRERYYAIIREWEQKVQ